MAMAWCFLLLLAATYLVQGACAQTELQVVAADDEAFVPSTWASSNDTRPSGRRVLQQSNTGQQSLWDNMNALVQAWCRYQSGDDCDEVDWYGTTDWYRRYFISRLPVTVVQGMSPPQISYSNQTVQEKVVSNFFCPYRNFTYTCQLDKQSFQQLVQTSTQSSGWNVGSTTKVSAIFGIDFIGTGSMTGATAQFSFSYSFQDAVATATTEQTTTVQSVSVKMDPTQQQCLLLSTHLAVVKASGKQSAYVAVSNWVGTHQDDSHHWRLDAKKDEKHYFRAMTFSYLVTQAQKARLPEAAQWTVVGTQARINMPFDLDVEFGTKGYTTNQYAPVDSAQCKSWDGAAGLSPDLLAALTKVLPEEENP